MYGQVRRMSCSVAIMSAYTEVRIVELCGQAVGAQTEADMEHIVQKLRSALKEHIRSAKASLEPQASTIAALDSEVPKVRAA